MNTLQEDEMQILIRTTEELKKTLQKEAKRIGITLNALILQILWEWVKREGQGAVESGAEERERGEGDAS